MNAKIFLLLCFTSISFSLSVSAGLLNEVEKMPESVTQAFVTTFTGFLTEFIEELLDSIAVFITESVDISLFFDHWLLVTGIISGFYLLNFLFVGLKFLLGSYSEVQRKQAKDWFKSSVLVVLAVNASFLVYSLLLELSSSIAIVLWKPEFESLFLIQNLSSLNLIWLMVFAFSLFSAAFSLILRHFLLIAGVMLFPIAIFLFFVLPLKKFGLALTAVLCTAVFLSVLDSILLNALWITSQNFAQPNMLMLSTFFLLLFLTNTGSIAAAVLYGFNSK